MQAPGKYDNQANRYDESSQSSTYHRSEGLLVLPVAGPVDTPPAIIMVHAPIGYRTTKFMACKRGVPPMFPAQQDTPSGDKILSSSLHFPLPVIGGQSSQYDYAVGGEYSFVQYGPRNEVRAVESNPGSQSSSTDNRVTQVYGPRGNVSIYNTGRHPYLPILINAMIEFAGGVPTVLLPTIPNPAFDPNAPVVFISPDNPGNSPGPTIPNPDYNPDIFNNPGLQFETWAWAYPGSPEIGTNVSALPFIVSAAADLDLSQNTTAYYDTAIGPTFFSPSLIS